jgi:hypothetical protein
MWGLGQHTLLGIVVGLLKYAGLQATHYAGYCCWFMWGLGQHTLLGIVVGSCGVSGNTLYWVLLLVYVGPWATHFTGSVGFQQWV